MTVTSVQEPDGILGERSFVPRRTLQISCILCFVFFVPLTVAGIWLPLANPDGSFLQPGRAAVIGGSVFGFFTLLSAYMILAFHRMRITTHHMDIRIVGPFHNRLIKLSDVVRARWRLFPNGGSLVLYTQAQRAVVEFASFEASNELLALLRRTIPKRVQEDYQPFESSMLAVRRPAIVGASATLKLATVSLALAGIWCLLWKVDVVRMTSCVPLLTCPVIMLVAMLDLIRRRSLVTVVAAAIASLAVVVLFLTIWPTIWQIVA